MPLIIDEKKIEKLKKGKRLRRLRMFPPKTKAERELLTRMNRLWKDILFPASERIKNLVASGASVIDIADLIDEVLNTAQEQYRILSDDVLWRWLASSEQDTKTAMLKGLNRSLGIDVTALYDTQEVSLALQGATIEASNLIKSIPEQYLGAVAKAVADNMTGKPLPSDRSLIEQIETLGNITKNRARLIARDQTNKVVGNLNRARQQALGIRTYIWRTVKDERVVGKPGGRYPEGGPLHGNHYMMEGVLCQWDDPTVMSRDGGTTWVKRDADMPDTHPGKDIQCRCHAEAVIDVQEILKRTQTL